MKVIARKPPSTHHHTNGLFQTRQVLKRITSNQKEIGPFSHRYCAEFFSPAQDHHRIDRRRANRLVGGETAFSQQLPLTVTSDGVGSGGKGTLRWLRGIEMLWSAEALDR